MMLKMSEENQKWVKEVYGKIIAKETKVMRRSGDKIPFTTKDGVFADKFPDSPTWWTNGFWPGCVWQMYNETKDDFYKDLANRLEERLDGALFGTYQGSGGYSQTFPGVDALHHDVGFMWLLSSVANYRLTGNARSRTRGMIAANFLASRFNIDAGFITAWNGAEHEAWSIIDTMMNLPLLYWAAEEADRPRFKKFALAHADKTLENVIRPDGSVIHIIEYDLVDGSVVTTYDGQGYSVGSSWTRGQAWALYGFTLSYLRTGEERYLEGAKRVAHYFIAAAADNGYVPPIDFRSPAEPALVDTTAGAIAACGLIEIAKSVGEFERSMYLNAAVRILRAMEEKHADWSDEVDPILRHGSNSYKDVPGRHIDIIYGDYYFIEAVFKLNGSEINLW